MSRKLIRFIINPISKNLHPLKPISLYERNIIQVSSVFTSHQKLPYARPTVFGETYSRNNYWHICKPNYSYHFISFSTKNKDIQTALRDGNIGVVGKESDDTVRGSKSIADLENVPKTEEVEKLSLFKRFKAMYRDYWYVLLPVHVVTSIGWFGMFFYLAKSGVDLASMAQSLNLSDSIVEKIREKGNTTAGYLAVSYLLYKVATPLRYTVTLGGTTISINYLRRWGYIKPIPKKEELKRMFHHKREQFKEKKECYKKNFKNLKRKKS